jgi:hypothetical protein
MQFAYRQFIVRIKRTVFINVFLQDRIFGKERKEFGDDVVVRIVDVIINPLIRFSMPDQSVVFQISQVSGRFSLCKIEDQFQIRNAHFLVLQNEMKNANARFVAEGLVNFCPFADICMFDPDHNKKDYLKIVKTYYFFVN